MYRVGFGYDSHRLAPGRELVLARVRVAGEAGLAGHSDADAILHAITDAILGAMAAGDIGEHFPDSDPQWAGADSAMFVQHALRIASEKGYRVVNCDVTVLAEEPRLSPYRQAMRQNIADSLGVGCEAVSVKAKTNEGMGFIGHKEGIAALAVVMMSREPGGHQQAAP